MKKKILSIVLAIMMVLSVFPMAAFAADGDPVTPEGYSIFVYYDGLSDETSSYGSVSHDMITEPYYVIPENPDTVKEDLNFNGFYCKNTNKMVQIGDSVPLSDFTEKEDGYYLYLSARFSEKEKPGVTYTDINRYYVTVSAQYPDDPYAYLEDSDAGMLTFGGEFEKLDGQNVGTVTQPKQVLLYVRKGLNFMGYRSLLTGNVFETGDTIDVDKLPEAVYVGQELQEINEEEGYRISLYEVNDYVEPMFEYLGAVGGVLEPMYECTVNYYIPVEPDENEGTTGDPLQFYSFAGSDVHTLAMFDLDMPMKLTCQPDYMEDLGYVFDGYGALDDDEITYPDGLIFMDQYSTNDDAGHLTYDVKLFYTEADEDATEEELLASAKEKISAKYQDILDDASASEGVKAIAASILADIENAADRNEMKEICRNGEESIRLQEAKDMAIAEVMTIAPEGDITDEMQAVLDQAAAAIQASDNADNFEDIITEARSEINRLMREADNVKPVAKVEETTVDGYDYAVKYSIAEKGSEDYYNDWNADIVITADKDVAEGAVTLIGEYGKEKESAPICAMKANEGVSVLKTMGLSVTYWDLVNSVKEFTCGVVNNSLLEGTNFTIKVVLSNGTESFVVDGSTINEEVAAADVKPTAKVEETTVDGYDYAVKYSIAKEGSEIYNDWNADIIITADKDVAAGAVTLKGQYGDETGSYAVPAMKANEGISLIKTMGYDVTYWDLVNSVKEFTCGVVNNSLEDDTNFTIKVVLSNGTESFVVDGSTINEEVAAADVKPTAKVEETTVDGLKYAVKYSIEEEGSENYNGWNADIIITADKDVPDGSVILKGQYGSYDLTELPTFPMKANQGISLLEKFGLEPITYEYLKGFVNEFTCGIADVNLAENTNFTIKVVLSNGTESFVVDGSEKTVAAAPEVEKFDVKVNGGATVTQKLDPAKSPKYEIATVKIKEANGVNANGDWFVYWVDQNGKIVSTYSTYSFFVVEDRTLTPVYVSKDVYQTERAKGIIVTDIVRSEDNGDGTATLYAERSASKAAVGNSIKQHGVIYTTNSALVNDLTIDSDSDEVYKNPAQNTATDLTGLYRITVRPEDGDTVYAVSYLIDANDVAHYGDVETVKVTNGIPTLSVSSDTFDTVLTQEDEVIPAEEDTPAVEEPVVEEPVTVGSVFTGIINGLINAIVELVQFIISIF